MHYEHKNLHLSCSVVALALNDSGIVAIDSILNIYNYSLECEYKNYINVQDFNSYFYRYGYESDISKDGRYGLFCDSKNDRVLYLDIENRVMLLNIRLTKSPEYCTFSNNGRYFMIANAIGHLCIYETFDFSLLFEIAIPDAFANASFSDDASKIAISSLNKKLFIIDMATKKVQQQFQLDNVGQALCFSVDGSQITLFTRDGNTFIINLSLERIFRATPCSEWPTYIAHTSHSDIILLGTRSAQLFIYTSSKGICLGSVLFDNWGISSVSIHQNKILVGFSDGNVTIIDITKIAEEAFSYLNASNYKKLSILVGNSPLIFVNEELCKEITEKYVEIFTYVPVSVEEKIGFDAIASLIVSNNKKRLQLLNSLFHSEQYAPFMDNLEKGEIEIACNSAYDFPLLRQLREFHELRTICFKNITDEIRLLEASPLKFKTFIEAMPRQCTKCLHNILPTSESLEKAFEQLKTSASSNNYPNLMAITEQYPVFRQTRLYRRMMNYGEAMIDKILMMKSGDMQEALMLATKLTRLAPFSLTGFDFKMQIENYERFVKADQTQNIEQIFLIATENPMLKTTEIFKKHMLLYKTLYDQLKGIAKDGNVTAVLTMIGPYINIDYFEDKNNELHKLALISEIALYTPHGSEAELLNKYHECFGWDKEYEEVCHKFHIVSNPVLVAECSNECKLIHTFINGEKVKRKEN